MSLYQYLQLQPIDPQDDGTVSDLDEYQQDEVIDLNEDTEDQDIVQAWERLEQDMHSTSKR